MKLDFVRKVVMVGASLAGAFMMLGSSMSVKAQTETVPLREPSGMVWLDAATVTADVPFLDNYTQGYSGTDYTHVYYDPNYNETLVFIVTSTPLTGVSQANAVPINYSGTFTYQTVAYTFSGNDYIFDGRQVGMTADCFMLLAVATPDSSSGDSSEPEESPAAVFNKEIDNKTNEIALAAQGISADGSVNATKTIEYTCPGALSGTIMQEMTKHQDVTLIYTFTYEGIIFQSTISGANAANVFSADIPWYGPCYIANNFPTVPVGLVS